MYQQRLMDVQISYVVKNGLGFRGSMITECLARVLSAFANAPLRPAFDIGLCIPARTAGGFTNRSVFKKISSVAKF